MARKKPAKKIARTPKPDPAPVTGVLPAGYASLLEDLKTRVRAAQVKAVLSVNRELIQLYWDIGRLIVERQEREAWGASVLERLADDLQKALPGVAGFSRSNVFRMRAFCLAYSQPQIVAQPVRPLRDKKIVAQAVRQMSPAAPPESVAAIPWGHNIVLLQKISDPVQRLWYAEQATAHGWSRAVLTVQIETDLYSRQGAAVTNFAATLPAPQSDLAQQTIKDPYIFDFLTLHADAVERDLEKGLIDHVRQFLLELGAGFAFVGQQVHLQVGDDDFFLDLLFYHLHLRCFVVVDLKMQTFTPEDAGKMNFYLSTVDEQMRHPQDQPTIGLILCKANNRLIRRIRPARREQADRRRRMANPPGQVAAGTPEGQLADHRGAGGGVGKSPSGGSMTDKSAIANDWLRTTIGQIADINPGLGPIPDVATTISFIAMADLGQGMIIKNNKRPFSARQSHHFPHCGILT